MNKTRLKNGSSHKCMRDMLCFCFFILAAIAVQTGCNGTRGVAETGLIEAADAGQRYRAVQEITDQSTLAGIVLEDEDWAVRYAVAQKLDDPSALAEVVLRDDVWMVRKAAAERIDEESVLEEVVKEDDAWQVRRAAVNNIRSQQLLEQVALEDGSALVRKRAVSGITDQTVLVKVARNDSDETVRSAAAGRIDDEEILIDLVAQDGSVSVSKAALKGISDQSAIIEIASRETNIRVRRAAVRRIDDENELARIAVDDPDWQVRRSAKQQLPAQRLQQLLADTEEYGEVYRVADDIEIDGDLSKWEDYPAIVLDSRDDVFRAARRDLWKGPEDLSAKIYKGWDDEYIYFAVSVTDDKHFNEQEANSIWDGDALQFAYDPFESGEQPTQLAVALASGRVQGFQYEGELGILDRSEYVVVRDEEKNKTYYEMRFPMEEMHIQPEKFSSFGFNTVIFDDDDGEGQDYWMQITHGVAGGWAPHAFRSFVLLGDPVTHNNH